jgi:serine phosphatase RsbU (regulator of sigma subunit)
MAGEEVAGDACTWRVRDDRLALLVADGLGHGLQAHEAARAAIESFARAHAHTPARIIEGIHAALRPTRGAAVAALAADLERGVVRYCALGNISGHIARRGGPRVTMVSHPGTAGHTAARIQEFSYAMPADALIVMHSDGISAGWDLASYPGIRARHPSIVCAAIYRDFSRQRDDVVVVAAGRRPEASSADEGTGTRG